MNAAFFGLALIVIGLVLGLAVTSRPKEGLLYGWLFALLLLPGWMEAKAVGKFTVDLRTVAVLAAGLGFLVSPVRGLRVRRGIGDLLYCTLLGSMLMSEYRSGEFGVTTAPTVLMHWGLPYLVGRHFFRSGGDLWRVERFLAFVMVFLTLYGVFEMVTRTNPFLLMTGQRFFLLEMEQGERLGLKRAQGMSSHPIFFGLTLVLLLPWAFVLARRARDGEAPRWNRWLPAIVGVGVLSTLSRGPVLAGLLTALGVVFFRKPRLRLVLAVLVLMGGAFAAVGGAAVVSELSKLIGEDDENGVVILVNGEYVKYTGTRHRVLQFRAYDAATAHTGLFGYGGQLKAVRTDYPVHPLFWSIDCHYLLFLLQYGWSGQVLFVLVLLATLHRLGRLAWSPDRPLADLAGGLCASMAAVGLALSSVYLSLDFEVFWVFYAGLAGNLEALEDEVYAEEEAFEDDPVANDLGAPAPLALEPPETSPWSTTHAD